MDDKELDKIIAESDTKLEAVIVAIAHVAIKMTVKAIEFVLR